MAEAATRGAAVCAWRALSASPGCAVRLRDGFASREECAALREAARAALAGADGASQPHLRGVARYRSAGAHDVVAVAGDATAAEALRALLARVAEACGVAASGADDVMLAISEAWDAGGAAVDGDEDSNTRADGAQAGVDADVVDAEVVAAAAAGADAAFAGAAGEDGDATAYVVDACGASDVDSEGFLIEARDDAVGFGGVDPATPLMNLHHDHNANAARVGTLMVYLGGGVEGGETMWPCAAPPGAGAEAGVEVDAAEVDECAAALDALHAAGARHARCAPSPGEAALPPREAAAADACVARYYDLRHGADGDAEAEACERDGVWLASGGDGIVHGALVAPREGRAVWFEHGGGAAAWHAPCAPTGGEPKYTLTVFKAPRRA